jgi:hypothetical protein
MLTHCSRSGSAFSTWGEFQCLISFNRATARGTAWVMLCRVSANATISTLRTFVVEDGKSGAVATSFKIASR